MSTRPIVERIGLSLLLVAFVYSGWRAMVRVPRENAGKIVIRLAHDNAHASVRRAWATVVADYERQNPAVRVEILEIPNTRNLYVNTWTRTQLVGGTAPDLMKAPKELTDAELAQFFRPLTRWLEQPNPYHRGTPWEGLRWRDSFLDGLTSRESMPPSLAEVYRVPIFAATTRMYYNRDLIKAALGRDEPPRTFAEFLDWCRALDEHSKRTSLRYVPISGGEESLALLFNRIFAQQTQRRALEVDPKRALNIDHSDAAIAYFLGRWSVDTRPAVDGFQLIRELGRYMQPGFLQTRRDEMSLLFRQQRAAMISSGSWDASYFLNDSPFRVGVFTLPIPAGNDPVYGGNALGTLTESQLTENGFGLTQSSRNPEAAVDFLRYLSSAEVNARFCQIAERVPAVVGAEPAPSLADFAIAEEQWPWGYTLDLLQLGGRWVDRAIKVNLHLLVGERGSVATFVEAYRDEFDHAIRRDTAHYVESARRTTQRFDATIVAHHVLAANKDPAAERKASMLLENQNLHEGEMLQLSWALQHGRRPNSQR